MKGPPMALKGLAGIGREIPGPLPAAAALEKNGSSLPHSVSGAVFAVGGGF